ncbi:MAG: hypothetical protein IPM53_34435 [Anaerolineaceae bacterium]|nr:hypothetical protein [Anaerolineaceae bacterium]
MTDSLDAQLCYLFTFPHLGTAVTQPATPLQKLKDAPYFKPVDMEVQLLEATAVQIEGIQVLVQAYLYEREIQVLECRLQLKDVLSSQSLQLKERLEAGLVQTLVPTAVHDSGLYEEYVLLLLASEKIIIDQFVAEKAQLLARFLRSQREVISSKDVTTTLATRVRYSEQDMTILDWEGGIVLALDGDFQSEIEVIKIANYQLLRYRMIDQRIEKRLETLRVDLHRRRRRSLFPSTSRRALQQIIQERLTLLLDFERIDQELLMIGDWYTAQLYRAVFDELYMDEWKQTVKSKLESLQSILQVVQDNFSVSWSVFLDMVQLVGWLLLLLGYIVLFFLDLRLY